ncbi:MAG TPA: sugar diacid recognition domain-containing protein [Thauera sp.]|uniref:sugar diacid recognition domain-containing protein n=1 Tax=Thauera sp. TaxID=1905334 RepID=UPI002C9A0C29|nr:sugar diacid recognition domain-containing protein [Thauera sp.]HRP25893.1 sugar diacid recognition domain-containing protein [Thauera sp.]HRP66146.1 sugar diacid recognition domain-containing protein [Thauera sp.]
MFLLDASLAQSIVDRAMEILHTNVNVMDERGLIIASGERSRIGSRHEGALLVLAQGRAVEIDEVLAGRLHDARPGINLPLRAEGRVVGVVGLSGTPAAIGQHAELVRMAAETMLEQAGLMQVLARDLRLREELVLQLIGVAPATPALEDWARRLQVDLGLPRVAVLIEIDASALPADAVLAEQQRLQALLATPDADLLWAAVSLRELVVLLPLPSGSPAVEGGGDPGRLRARLESLRVRLSGDGALRLRLALGGHFAGSEGLQRSWQSARATLRVGRRRQPAADLHCYAELTLAVLLAGLAEGWRADELQRPLQRLAAHDRDGLLRRTLTTWFAHDMKTAAAAQALHVHRNTLDYRLRRIADITGLDLARLDDCLLLFIGLELNEADF